MPRQAGAFHPDRIGRYTREHHELAQGFRIGGFGMPGNQMMKLLEERGRLLRSPPLDGGGHERGRGPGYRAPRTLECRILDSAILDSEPHRHLVATQRVVPLRLAV